MKKIGDRINMLLMKARILLGRNDGFGLNELLGIAAALILAAFIIIPGLKTFASSVMGKLSNWWDTTIVDKIFPTSL